MQTKRMLLQRRLRNILFASGIIMIIWIFIGGDLGLLAMFQSKRYETRLREIIKTEEEHTQKLDLDINKLENDSFYIEQIARTQMGMIQKNEIVYKFNTKLIGDKK